MHSNSEASSTISTRTRQNRCPNKLAATSEARTCPRKANRALNQNQSQDQTQTQNQDSQQTRTFNPFKRFYNTQDNSRPVSKMSSNSSTTVAVAPVTAAPNPMPSANSNPRVVVTTHAADGTSIFDADRELPLFRPFGPGVSSFAVLDKRGAVPVSNQELTGEFTAELPRCPPGGVIFCITNIPGNFAVPMHRTVSLDYAIVMSGEIVIKLDNGEEKTVHPGEYIIQGGVNHQWINRTDEICRIAVVMVGAEKVKLADGTVLEETVLKRPS